MTPRIVEGMSHEAYLAEDGYLSSSRLKSFLPEFYKPFNGSSFADFGSVFHQRFAGEDVTVFQVLAATWQGKAAQKERETILAAGGLPILVGDVPLLDGMEAAVRAHSVASGLLVDAPGSWELSVFTEIDGVPCKARFDRLLEDGKIVDVKTTKVGARPYDIARSVLEFGYDVQEWWYRAVAAAAGIDVTGYRLVFVPKDPPHLVNVVELEPAFMDRAEVLVDLGLNRYLHPQMVDAYPGENATLTLSLPRWAELD